LATCEVTPQAIWPVAKSLTKSGGPKASSAIHGPLGHIFYPIDKANIIADCLENQFTVHDLCDCDHRRRVEAKVEVLLATVDEDAPFNFRPCDVSKEIQSLKLQRACDFDGVQNVGLRHLPRPLVHFTHVLYHCLRLGHFAAPWKETKITTLPKPGKDLKFPLNVCPISLLSTTGKLFGKQNLRKIQKRTEERNLLNASHFGFRIDHSTTLQCMRLADHITLKFSNNISTAAVFFCKLQRGLTAVKSWCERSTIKINEGKIQAIYFSRRLRVPDFVLKPNGQDVPFVNNVTI
jgi:hypothetical protein